MRKKTTHPSFIGTGLKVLTMLIVFIYSVKRSLNVSQRHEAIWFVIVISYTLTDLALLFDVRNRIKCDYCSWLTEVLKLRHQDYWILFATSSHDLNFHIYAVNSEIRWLSWYFSYFSFIFLYNITKSIQSVNLLITPRDSWAVVRTSCCFILLEMLGLGQLLQ